MGTFNADLTNYDQVVYPVLAAPAAISTDSSAWTYTGSYTTLLSASTIATDFYLVGVTVMNGDVKETQVKIGVGGAGSEADIFQAGYDFTNAAHVQMFFPSDPIKISGNARVAFDAADEEAAANTVKCYAHFKKP